MGGLAAIEIEPGGSSSPWDNAQRVVSQVLLVSIDYCLPLSRSNLKQWRVSGEGVIWDCTAVLFCICPTMLMSVKGEGEVFLKFSTDCSFSKVEDYNKIKKSSKKTRVPGSPHWTYKPILIAQRLLPSLFVWYPRWLQFNCESTNKALRTTQLTFTTDNP